MQEHKTTPQWLGYAVLILVIYFFSGLAAELTPWADFFDFNTVNGAFGKIGETMTFLGTGGNGARHGFLFALSLVPGIMLALGIVEVAEHLGALHAASRILTPLMRPLLGLPGIVGLALISSLQSSDAGAAMTAQLKDKGMINDTETTVFGMFQFSSGASVLNYLTSGMAILPFMSVKLITPLLVMLLFKVVGANIMRFYLYCIGTEDISNEQQS